MPPPIDIDREQVRMLVLSVGVREAARSLNLSENTVSAWSARYSWLADTRPKPPVDKPASMISASTASISPVKAMEGVLERRSKLTRFALSKVALRGALHASQMKGDEILTKSKEIKDLTSIASTVGGWEEGTNLTQINIGLMGS